ncbi:MAG: histidine triad nucleotide-binding protein [Clostridia bacterium]|nr:histidine triad nucleotide-binding protein [Clostridia bacterium]
MQDCIFCKIISGEIPSSKVYEDEYVYAFNDINPMAPVHILVIPKTHISNVMDVNSENSDIIAHIFEAIAVIAKQQKLEKGFRVVSNCNEYAGQTVFHLHFHILGGRRLSMEMA